MHKLSLRLLCQLYVLMVLSVVALLFLPVYSWLALGLIPVAVFFTLRPGQVRFRVVITTGFSYFLPLLLLPFLNSLAVLSGIPLIVPPMVAAISILPVIYLLDHELKQQANQAAFLAPGKPEGRYVTPVSGALFTMALVIPAAAIILNNLTLLFTSSLIILYLLSSLLRAFLAMTKLPPEVPVRQKRVIAGAEVHLSFHITSEAATGLHGQLSPVEPWTKVTPQRFFLSGNKTELEITLTPPLAGMLQPRFQISVTDQWGFLQVVRSLKPVALQVIPRAKYAEWLANKYLEYTGTGAIAGSPQLLKTTPALKRGVDYFDSRVYQPGDQFKDIDWKHTIKLNRLISKEYIGSGEQNAIIAVNLSVTDAEEADKLAFDLITTALTLAGEAIPTVLTAYDQQGVIRYSGIGEPGEVLKQTLSLVKRINTVEAVPRSLQLPDIGKLKQHIYQLKQATSEPVRRLLNVLNFEYQALEKAAKDHPATRALALATKQVPASTTIILVSRRNHDAEALLVATEKLAKQEFNILHMAPAD